MSEGIRQTAGINTTSMQEKHRGRAIHEANKIKTAKPPTLTQQRTEWLRGLLADVPERMLSPNEVRAAAESTGLFPSEESLNSIKKDAGVLSVSTDSGWMWKLPSPDETDEEDETREEGVYPTPPAESPIVARDRIIPGEDEFSLTDAEKKSFGIAPTEEHCWIRDDRYWGNKVPGNRQRQFLRENHGARIITVDGEPVTNGTDLILAVRPKSEVEAKAKRDAQVAADYDRRIEREKLDDDEFDPSDREGLNRRKHLNTEAHIAAGMIGANSPSSGLAYEDYVKWRGLTREDIEREERQYSLRRYSVELDGEAADEAIAAARRGKDARGRDSGGKFISIPPNVRPRNLATKP